MLNNPTVDLSTYPKDKDGYYVIFDGKTFNGWRGYGKDKVPSRWTIDDGAIKFNGSGGGEAQTGDGGDLIFAHKFKNFELELEWKVSKGGNSGILYLGPGGRHDEGRQAAGSSRSTSPAPSTRCSTTRTIPTPSWAWTATASRRRSTDMIPAVPQNAKPYGEWNKAKIMVYKGTVVHGQNDKNVVEYHLWTPQWTEMLENEQVQPRRSGRWHSSC